MKPKLILFSLVGLLVAGVLFWFFWRPGPSIRFVAFREGKQGRIASFEIINDTGAPYSCHGLGRAPYCHHKIATPSGWQTHGPRWFLTPSDTITLEPRSSLEIEVADVPASPFAVGVYFERGTAAEVNARRHGSKFFSGLLWELDFSLQRKIHPKSLDLNGTWSRWILNNAPTWSNIVNP